jgi:hypothetical protein
LSGGVISKISFRNSSGGGDESGASGAGAAGSGLWRQRWTFGRRVDIRPTMKWDHDWQVIEPHALSFPLKSEHVVRTL